MNTDTILFPPSDFPSDISKIIHVWKKGGHGFKIRGTRRFVMLFFSPTKQNLCNRNKFVTNIRQPKNSNPSWGTGYTDVSCGFIQSFWYLNLNRTDFSASIPDNAWQILFIIHFVCVCVCVCGATTNYAPSFLRTHTHTVGLLWTNDQPVKETSIWQHAILIRNKHPRPQWESNPQSRRSSDRRTSFRPHGHTYRHTLRTVWAVTITHTHTQRNNKLIKWTPVVRLAACHKGRAVKNFRKQERIELQG